MVQLDLTPEEQQVLVEVLNTAISNLSMEIADTDRKDYRDVLKTRKEALSKAVQGLQ